MAKISIVARNEKRKRLAQKYAAVRARLKREGRWEELHKLPRNSSPVRIRNRCAVTGRGRAVYRKLGLCRIILRQLALEGKIPGVQKASW